MTWSGSNERLVISRSDRSELGSTVFTGMMFGVLLNAKIRYTAVFLLTVLGRKLSIKLVMSFKLAKSFAIFLHLSGRRSGVPSEVDRAIFT